MLVIKELKDCLFSLTEIVVVLIELQLILTEDISFRELKLKITTFKLMEEIFMISRLKTSLSNMMKSEKYQQDNVMITQLVVYWILLIFRKITD